MDKNTASISDEIPQWKRVLNLVCCVEQNEVGGNTYTLDQVQPVQKSKSDLAREAAAFLDEPEGWRR